MPTTPVIINYDIAVQKQCNGNSGSTTSDVPVVTVFRDNLYEFDIQLYNVWPATYDVSEVGTWKMGIGNLNSTPLVESTTIDVSNAASGHIIFDANLHSTTLDTAMGTTAQKTYYCEVNANSSSDATTICLFPLYVKNTLYNT